jgi:hypothetical protein
MSHRLSLALLSTMFIFSVGAAFAAPAANCDVSACTSICQKRNPQGAAGSGCNSYCQITMAERKKKGQCK